MSTSQELCPLDRICIVSQKGRPQPCSPTRCHQSPVPGGSQLPAGLQALHFLGLGHTCLFPQVPCRFLGWSDLQAGSRTDGHHYSKATEGSEKGTLVPVPGSST